MTFSPLPDVAWTNFAKYLINGATSFFAWFAEIDCKIVTALRETRAE